MQIDEVDPKSRHKGKLETESFLDLRGVNWTSIRPVYIYGPLNYNPVEEWFFHRLKAGRPIPIPGSGIQITQLGHVKVSETAIPIWFNVPVKVSKEATTLSQSVFPIFFFKRGHLERLRLPFSSHTLQKDLTILFNKNLNLDLCLLNRVSLMWLMRIPPRIWRRHSLLFLVMRKPASKCSTFLEKNTSRLMD